MRISIITVTLNSAKYLEDCIKSIINQSHPDIEHIIVDGGSTDGTLAIIEKYKDSIAKCISEKDRGMYDALNKGMALASGDVIGVLNSDDILASHDVISTINECFRTHKVDSVYGDLVYVQPNNMQKVLRVWKGFNYRRYKFFYGWMPAHPTFYVCRDIIKQLGNYETHYFTAADFEFMARYLFKHRISSHYIPKLLVKMRDGGISNNSIKSRLRANRRDYLAMKRNGFPFPLISSVLKPLRKIPQYSTTVLHKFFGKKISTNIPPVVEYFTSEKFLQTH